MLTSLSMLRLSPLPLCLTVCLSRHWFSIPSSCFTVLPAYAIQHDLFTYVVWYLQYSYRVLEHYSSLHLPETLSFALMTCFRDLVGLAILRMIYSYIQAAKRTTWSEFKADAIASGFNFAKNNFSIVANELKKEEDKMAVSLEADLKDANRTRTFELPAKGRTSRSLLMDLKERSTNENKKWEEGLVSGAVYCGEKEHTELLSAAYAAFSLANPLHPDIWPSVNQFEAEVCSMTANMLNGTMLGHPNPCKTVVGQISSGGTESIVLASKAHRDFYRLKKSVRKPEIISCVTAHAAIDKACDILGCRNVKVPYVPGTYKIDLDAVERAISSDTILIYSSAPSFPQGVIDPIEALSKLAIKYSVGLHVDCCLGGFVLPFAKKSGYPIPDFDFVLPGVTSMSCDTHKYGYASKGTSVVLYRNVELRRAQYFCYPEWTGGLYVTPTIAGSRPGALSAACWASMMAMGEDGYTERVTTIMDTTKEIAEKVAAMDGLYLLGDPKSMIVCFGSKVFNIYRVGDKMTHKGWSLNSLQKPSCIHLCVTLRTVEHKSKFIDDLQSCVDEVNAEPSAPLTGNAAIYGSTSALPPGPISDLLCCYTDVVNSA